MTQQPGLDQAFVLDPAFVLLNKFWQRMIVDNDLVTVGQCWVRIHGNMKGILQG